MKSLEFIGDLPKSPEQQEIATRLAKKGYMISFTDSYLYFGLKRHLPDDLFDEINQIIPIFESDMSDDDHDWVVYEYKDKDQQRMSSFNYQITTNNYEAN